MCGIAGLYQPVSRRIYPELISEMLSQIQYRGPDEAGIYIGEGISLGSVRLSIIDRYGGQQPMTTLEEDLWIVYNGEIFNYIELRKELQNLGYSFRTSSDTEVLLILYRHFKERCLEKLNGQFAFAIWNSKKKELFLARDRMGIRPLYYFLSKEGLFFASEMKCLFKSKFVQPEIDPDSLNQAFTFWSIPSPDTIFKGVKELPPGHFLIMGKNEPEIQSYWDLSFPPQEEVPNQSIEETAEEFEPLLFDAVKLRLRSDVQVAAYLSGGLDSSATTYFIKKVNPGVLNTFSIGFSEAEYDESYYQKIVAETLGTSHFSIYCKKNDIAANFRKVIWHTEAPLFRTGAVPMYMLSNLVNDHGIKVVITGEGADEFLGGYNIFKEALIREFWARQPKSKIRPLLLQKLYPYLSQFKGRNSKAYHFFFGYRLNETNSPVYSHLVRWNNSDHIRNHFSSEFQCGFGINPVDKFVNSLPASMGDWDLLSRAQWIESKLFLSGYLLSSQGDRVAMANSVEGRYPFLDHRVIEFCMKLRSTHKIKGLNEKYLLKYIMKNRLPEEVISRPKQAYRSPGANSFTDRNASNYLRETLSPDQIKKYGIFKMESVGKLINKIGEGKSTTENENMAISGILSTQLLIDQFIEGDNPYNNLKLNVECPVTYDKRLTYKS